MPALRKTPIQEPPDNERDEDPGKHPVREPHTPPPAKEPDAPIPARDPRRGPPEKKVR